MEETTKKPFDPTPHLMKMPKGGKEYLPAAARIAWFRDKFPIETGWRIVSTLVDGGRDAKFAVYRAEVINPAGEVVQTGTKVEDVQGFGDFMEKAETGAIARALAMCGFGILQAQEFDEGTERIADTPQPARRPQGTAPTSAPTTTQKPAQGAQKPAPASSGEEPPVPSEDGGEAEESAPVTEEAPARTAPEGGKNCVVCQKELGKGRLGWCSAKHLQPHCPTCTLPTAAGTEG